MAVGGAAHFVLPDVYARAIPRAMGAARPWVYASGVAEVTSGFLLAIPRTRRLGGAVTAAVLLAICPANVKMALDSGGVWWARLALQAPLVWWAWCEGRRTRSQEKRASVCASSSAADAGTL